LITFLWRLILDGVAGVKFIIDGNIKDALAVMRAHFHFYASLPGLRKKRSALKQIKVGQVYQRNIVYEHFLRKVKTFTSLNAKRFSQTKS
jgi:hypothetical protein